jgi:hypothetical protein
MKYLLLSLVLFCNSAFSLDYHIVRVQSKLRLEIIIREYMAAGYKIGSSYKDNLFFYQVVYKN